MRRYLLHSCVFLQLEGLEQQLTSSLATGRDSAGRWSQMHSSVALQQRMSQLKDRGGARLQKLQDAMLDHFWSALAAGVPSGPDAQVKISCGSSDTNYGRLTSITDEELSYLTSTYGHVLKYELGVLGYDFEFIWIDRSRYFSLSIRRCWTPHH